MKLKRRDPASTEQTRAKTAQQQKSQSDSSEVKSSGKKTQQSSRSSATKDTTSVSAEAAEEDKGKESKEPKGGFSSFLDNLKSNFDSSAKALDGAGDRARAEQRRQDTQETGEFLNQYRDFTNEDDDITGRGDYEKIAKGERRDDFRDYLREEHSSWSDGRIDAEARRLEEHAGRLVNDDRMFDHFDTANQGGDSDGKISDNDLAAGILKSDISKDHYPQQSVNDILKLHEQNPNHGNRAITNRYYHQGQELNKLLGGDDKNFLSTWPAYGSLASNSVGGVIRDDGVPGNDTVKNAVASGNRSVFEDIAPHYDSYIKAVKADPENFDYEKWSRQEDFEGKDKLERSFGWLERARTANNSEQKQEYLLASNALAARHEQERLDDHIDRATAPVTGGGAERAVLEAAVDKDPRFYVPNGQGSGELDQLDISKKLPLEPTSGLNHIADPEVRRALFEAGGGDPEAPEATDPIGGRELLERTGSEDWSNLDSRMRTIMGLMVGSQNDSRVGEYVLDYDAPPGYSFTDHAGDFAKKTFDNAVKVAVPPLAFLP